MTTQDIWMYRDRSFGLSEMTGFEVEATDGGIGKVDEATTEAAGTGFIVVDTGPWIFGKKVMLPAGVIDHIDLQGQRVFVDRTKDEIKNAPEFDESQFDEPTYRDQLGGYYTSTGRGRTFDDGL
jgi:PRC-barrel domain